jgi:hypothetical protein
MKIGLPCRKAFTMWIWYQAFKKGEIIHQAKVKLAQDLEELFGVRG